jgi:methionyl-tRNA synthetase
MNNAKELKPFYVTTPIYYPNAVPHLGHAYTTVFGDSIHRYHRLMGYDSIFLTGTDEHGQKVADAAKDAGLSAQAHVDALAEKFQATWKNLHADISIFMRTTKPTHIAGVKAVLSKLHKEGLIYKDTHEGWYCVSEEIFYTEKDLVDGKSPTGKEVTWVSESNYFFKMSQYQEQMISYFSDHQDFIIPASRRAEILGFLKQPLQDLCISRPKSRLSWGIEMPFDPEFVCYVWFDALLNYVTALGYQDPQADQTRFQNYWPTTVHLLGKDILTTHAVYWISMLMALKLPLPRHIYAHGWWLNSAGKKMSKSEGDTVSPDKLIELLGADQTRYYLVRGMRMGNDASFNFDQVVTTLNDELADKFGNLLSRSSTIAAQSFDGTLGTPDLKEARSLQIKEEALKTVEAVWSFVQNMEPEMGLQRIAAYLTDVNKYISDMAPWKLVKTEEGKPLAAEVLWVCLESCRLAATLLWPVIPGKSEAVLNHLGVVNFTPDPQWLTWGKLPHGLKVKKAEPLFPKLERAKLPA